MDLSHFGKTVLLKNKTKKLWNEVLEIMDFESPDVEKDFPGLYASETGRKSNESDCK